MRKTLLTIYVLVATVLITALPVFAENASVYSGTENTGAVSVGKHRRLIAGPHVVARGKKIALSLKYSENEVTWKSSRKTTATVDKNGVVYGRKEGKTTITATENGKSYTWTVKVIKPRLRARHIIFYGGGRKARLWLKNAGGYGKTAIWSSSDPSVATVSARGVVKSRKRGTCTITASIGGTELTCRVRVRKKQGQKILSAW